MIQIRNLCKTYGVAAGTRRTSAGEEPGAFAPAASASSGTAADAPAAAPHALDNVTLDIADGDVMGIIGMSGAGKSTLVRCLNLLERPTSGQIVVDGRDVTELSGRELREYRRRVAMIFQNFGLLAQKTVLANVCFPFLAANGRVTAEDRERARELLGLVGLADRAESYPSQLSGGQQQRVAIARALACSPDYILCDEATSALDPASTNAVLKLLRQINRETGVTVIVITHSMGVVEKICKHVAVLEHGRVVEQGSVADVFAAPRSHAAQVLLERVDWDA